MMSDIPKRIGKENIDEQIARVGMIAELDAVNLYEQMATMATERKLKERLLDIAKEEKTHFGEFQTMLLKFDKQLAKELENGRKEVDG
ncbi:MAG: rubrerythrin [Candidatus Aenigmarchaeota archaeon]|nr:rubrerythrin [Candidatus Aenigmarchaeota archaeon]